MSKKRLDTAAIANELEESAFFGSPHDQESQPSVRPAASPQASPLTAPLPTANPQTTSQVTPPSVGQSLDQSTRPSTAPSSGAVVDRPKAFYITRRLDRWLDEAVRYLQEVHGVKKADRSTIINALLDQEAIWTEQALDELVGRVLSQLTSRLTSK